MITAQTDSLVTDSTVDLESTASVKSAVKAFEKQSTTTTTTKRQSVAMESSTAVESSLNRSESESTQQQSFEASASTLVNNLSTSLSESAVSFGTEVLQSVGSAVVDLLTKDEPEYVLEDDVQPIDMNNLILMDLSKDAVIKTRVLDLATNPTMKLSRQTTQPPSEHNVVFPSRVLSRNHAIFSLVDGIPHIQDKGSSNGTFLNGHRLSAEGVASEPEPLKNRDIITLGVDILNDNNVIVHHKVVLRVVLPEVAVVDTTESVAARSVETEQVNTTSTNVVVDTTTSIVDIVSEEIKNTTEISREMSSLKEELNEMDTVIKTNIMPSALQQMKQLEEAQNEISLWREKYNALAPLIAAQSEMDEKYKMVVEEKSVLEIKVQEMSMQYEEMKTQVSLYSETQVQMTSLQSEYDAVKETLQVTMDRLANMQTEKETVVAGLQDAVTSRDAVESELSALKVAFEQYKAENGTVAETIEQQVRSAYEAEKKTLEERIETMVVEIREKTSAYESIVQTFESTKTEFTQKLETVQKELTTVISEKETMVQERQVSTDATLESLTLMAAEKANMEEKVLMLQNEVVAYQSRVTELESLQSTVSERQVAMESVVEEKTVLQTLVVEKETVITKMMEEKTVIEHLVQEKETIISKMLEEKTVFENLVQEKEAIISRMSEEKTVFENLVHEKESVISRMSEEKTVFENLVREKEMLLTTVQSSVSQSESGYATEKQVLLDQVEALHRSIADLEDKIRESTQYVDLSNVEKQTLSEDLVAKIAVITALELTITELSQDKANLEAKLSGMIMEMQQKNEKITELRTELAHFESLVSEYETRVTVITTDRSVFEEKVSTLTASLAVLEQEKSELSTAYSSLESRHTELTSTLSRLSQASVEATSSTLTSTSRVNENRLVEQLESQSSVMTKMEQEMEELKSELEKEKRERSSLKTNLDLVLGKYNSLATEQPSTEQTKRSTVVFGQKVDFANMQGMQVLILVAVTLSMSFIVGYATKWMTCGERVLTVNGSQ